MKIRVFRNGNIIRQKSTSGSLYINVNDMVVYLKDAQSGIFEDKFEYKYHILGEKIINEFIETSIDVFVGQSINFDKNNPFGGKEEPDMSDM